MPDLPGIIIMTILAVPVVLFVIMLMVAAICGLIEDDNELSP